MGSATDTPDARESDADADADADAHDEDDSGGAKGTEERTRRPPGVPRTGPRPRYAVYHDPDLPHMRLGVIWFVAAVGALVVGRFGIALLYGGVAAVGALQTAKSWQRRRFRPNLIVAGAGALLMPLVAAFSARAAGAVILLIVGAALVMAGIEESRRPVLTNAGITVGSSVFVGLAATSMVLVFRYEPGAAISLLILASAYEIGDYIIGSGSPNPFEGPLAGLAAVSVLTFSLYVIEPEPFEAAGILYYGAAIALLAPVGQLFASWLLPESRAVASGLRRLDTLLIAGPVWLLLLEAGIGQ